MNTAPYILSLEVAAVCIQEGRKQIWLYKELLEGQGGKKIQLYIELLKGRGGKLSPTFVYQNQSLFLSISGKTVVVIVIFYYYYKSEIMVVLLWNSAWLLCHSVFYHILLNYSPLSLLSLFNSTSFFIRAGKI